MWQCNKSPLKTTHTWKGTKVRTQTFTFTLELVSTADCCSDDKCHCWNQPNGKKLSKGFKLHLAAEDDDERQKWMEAIWNARNAALYTWDHYSSHPLYPNLPKASSNEENILNKLVSQENLIKEQQLPPKCNAVDVARTLVLPRLKVLNVILHRSHHRSACRRTAILLSRK